MMRVWGLYPSGVQGHLVRSSGGKAPQKLEAVAVISVGDWGDERSRREDLGAEGAEG